MDKKILVLLLLGLSLLAFGCAGKKADAPPTIGAGDETAPAANDVVDDSGNETDENGTMGDSADDAMDDDGDETADGEVSTNASGSGKGLSDLADLFNVDTDKPLEGEGLDVKTPESNES